MIKSGPWTDIRFVSLAQRDTYELCVDQSDEFHVWGLKISITHYTLLVTSYSLLATRCSCSRLQWGGTAARLNAMFTKPANCWRRVQAHRRLI